MFYFVYWIKNLFKKEQKDIFVPPSKDKEPVGNILTTPLNANNMYNSWEQYAMLNVTGQFEGKGYGQVTDNFDGQGISLGIFQWCVGQGSLQEKILKPYFAANQPQNEVEVILKQISESTISKGMSLCKQHFLSGTKLKKEVRENLERFILNAKAYQIAASRGILNKAWGYCSSYDMMSLKSFCFFFDVVVQNGSMKEIKKPLPNKEEYKNFIEQEGGVNKIIWQEQYRSTIGIDDETIILCLLIKERALKNKWRSDVISRKGTIAHGKGIVHGKKYYFDEFIK